MTTALLLLALSGSAALPAPANVVPSPASAFGFEPCAERELATYDEISDYFRKLDAASDRMNLYEIGKTAEGRTMPPLNSKRPSRASLEVLVSCRRTSAPGSAPPSDRTRP